MIPSSIAALVSFLLLVAPGIVWQLQQQRYRPAVKDTILVEAGRVVLASFFATACAAMALLWVWLPLYRRAQEASPRAVDVPVDAVPYVAAAVSTSMLACGLVYLVAWLKWPYRAPIDRGRVWHQSFADLVPEGAEQPRLIVELSDGTIWRGALDGFDTDPEDSHRWLRIGPQLRRAKSRGEKSAERPGDRYALLPESQITAIEVAYFPGPRTRPGDGLRERVLRRLWRR